MHLRWLTVLGFFPSLFGYADTPSDMTLCDSNETVLFSCATSRSGTDPWHSHPIPRRIVSLCATSGVTAVSGRLIYRFGADKQHVELTYPSDGRVAGKAFTSEFDASAKSSWWLVTFRHGEYSYEVYNRLAAYEENTRSNGGGVRVTRRGELLSDLWCDGKEHSAAIEDKMWGIVQSLPESWRDAP